MPAADKRTVRSTALLALFTALGTAFLYMTALLPTGRLVLIFSAALAVAVVNRETSEKEATISFFLIFILSIIFVPSKLSVLIFGSYLGYFPILKTIMAKHWNSFWTSFLLRLLLFNLAMGGLFFLSRSLVFSESMPSNSFILILPVLQIVFIALEIALPMAMTIYEEHIRKHLLFR